MSARLPQFFYFDLGNVLLYFDHRRAAAQMAAVTGIAPQRAWDVLFEVGLQWRYERGELSSREFCDQFCAATGGRGQDAPLLRACADIFELNRPIMPVLAALRAAGCRLGILSNTNEAHWQFVTDGRYAGLFGFFELQVLSFQVQCMKPEARIYQLAAQRADCRADQIFFVDDRPENVAAATERGMDAVCYTGCEQLVCDLQLRGISCPM